MSSFASLLLVAALAVFVHVTVTEIVEEQTAYATKINISGQQRMLSQRAAFFATQYLDTGRDKDRELARESITRIQDNHAFLLAMHRERERQNRPSDLSPALLQLFFEPPYKLDRRVTGYVALVDGSLDEGSTGRAERVSELRTQSQQILMLFDRVVQQYERESQAKISGLTRLQNYIFLGIIVLVLYQVFYVIRPLLRESERLTDRLREDANRDYLTGLYNRRIFGDLAEQALSLSHRNRHPISLAVFDVDDFKAINDRHGHSVGDTVLCEIGRALMAACRKSDEVFRFGGEEFVLLLPETNHEGAMQVAEKVRLTIQSQSEAGGAWPCEVTISGGVATMAGAAINVDDLLRQADAALYEAKKQSKNQIVAVGGDAGGKAAHQPTAEPSLR